MILQRVPKCVIFDMDGVLLDTEPIYTVATERVASRYGKQYTWQLKRQIMGRDPRFAADFLIQHLGLPLTTDELLLEMKSLVKDLMPEAAAVPGAAAFVTALHARGVPLAVATSSARWLFEIKSARHDWFAHFRAVVCGDERGIRYKPAPDIFLAAAERLAQEPGDCLVFEDSLAGVEAALAAGMQVVALLDPRQERAAFGGASHVIAGFDELAPGELGFPAGRVATG